MEVVGAYRWPVDSLDSPVKLHVTGDWHLGARGCAEQRLEAVIAEGAEDSNARLLLMGDLAEWIPPTDARWDASAVSPSLSIADLARYDQAMLDRIERVTAPWSGRIIGALEGNHEGAYARRHGQDIGALIAEKIGTRNLRYSALLTLRFVDHQGKTADVSVLATHGAGAAATPGGKLARLVRLMQSADVDLSLMGHVHVCLDARHTVLRQDGDEIGARETLGVVTGTYLRTYAVGHSGYGERAGYSPVALGHPVISITPRTGEMAVSWARPRAASRAKRGRK